MQVDAEPPPQHHVHASTILLRSGVSRPKELKLNVAANRGRAGASTTQIDAQVDSSLGCNNRLYLKFFTRTLLKVKPRKMSIWAAKCGKFIHASEGSPSRGSR